MGHRTFTFVASILRSSQKPRTEPLYRRAFRFRPTRRAGAASAHQLRGSMRTIRSLHAYELSITAKTGTTTKENLEDAARTHHPPREPLQLPKGCMRTKRHAATTSQVYSEAPCGVASVFSRSAASFSLVRQRRPRKSRNVPPAIPYYVQHLVQSSSRTARVRAQPRTIRYPAVAAYRTRGLFIAND